MTLEATLDQFRISEQFIDRKVYHQEYRLKDIWRGGSNYMLEMHIAMTMTWQ